MDLDHHTSADPEGARWEKPVQDIYLVPVGRNMHIKEARSRGVWMREAYLEITLRLINRFGIASSQWS